MCRVLESLALLVAIALFSGCTAKEITYRTVEQRPRGTFIGNIKTSANFEQTLPPEEFKTIRFSFLPKDDPSSKFLRIKETTGEIFSNIPLDREKICDPSDTNCLVRFRVSVLSDSRSTFKVVHINIYIEDINDKYPIFPQSYVKLEIPENTKDSYEIRSAVDNDAGENSIQSYTLEPIDGPFELREVQQPGGNTKLSVVVKDMLDRETKDSYKVRVVARDGGSPMRTGEVLLDISVLDVNDHPPKFTKMEYRVSKAENASVGSSVVQVRADDADIGDNGRVTYHFVGRSSSVFSLNKTSGLVILEQSLDFEAQSQYRLTVEARDMGTPSQTSQALIVVTVLDVNDDHPRITFNLLSQDGYAEVPEDAIPGTFVAHVSVADGDSGINGEVSCRLDTDTFKLQKLDSSDFQVKLNAQLDREARDEYKVTMFCRDGGDPSLTASEVFTVKVKDVNDHSPLFLQTVYSVTIEENNKIGASLVRVSATDDDIGDNGKVFYELDIKARDQFRVDRKTGRITAQTRLDREKNPEIVFNVMAKDRGNPRRADSATVSVKVLDVNDERPIFEQSEYEFFVEEGMQPGTIVDSVYAMDFDSGLGGEVIYFILPQSDPQNLFSVSTTEGTIKLNQELDREVSPQHTFILRARDKGTPSLNTTVQVTVLVGDRNDNSPVFTFPSGLNNTVEILHSLRRNSLITTIQTYDLDEGRNALTSYRIEEGNSRGLFSLDEVSGALTVRKTMKKKDSGNYALLLVAQDMGVNGQITRKLLHVKVIQDNNTAIVPVGGGDSNHGFNATGLSNPEKASSEDDSNTMMIIVICVVVATVIISVVLIASICLVLRKRSSRRPEYFMKSEEQKIMKQKESPSSSLSGKIAPPSSPNQSDDHKLGKKEVSFSLEEVPQNPHNLTNSTHNTSFSTFKGQQSSSGTPSPTEHQLPLSVRTDGSGHSTPAGHSPVTEPAPAPAPAPSPHPQPNQHPMLPHKDQHWPQKRTVEVKHLLELLHKDDTHSDTSGETFTSDSGRGGSEDDSHCPRGQHYTPADPNHPKYYATKYTPPDGSLPRRKDMTRRAGSPNGGYTRFKSSGCPVPRLDLVSREDGDAIRCSSFRQPNYTTFKSATLPGVSSSPLASPLSCGSGCNLVSAVGDGNYQNVGPAVQSHSLERAKQHSPMFKVKAPGWEPISTNLGYPPPPYPDVVNSHDFNFDEGIGDSMAYCSRDDDETTTSGSYTVNQDDLCDDVNQLYFTDVVV